MGRPGLAAASLVLVLAACTLEGPSLDVEFGGCAAVLVPRPTTDPTCVLTAGGALDLWVRSDPGADLEIRAGDRAWEATRGGRVDGGFRLRLEDLDTGEIVVRAVLEGRASRWQLAVDRRPLHAVEEADRLIKARQRDRARRFLEARFDAGGPPLLAGLLRSRMARLAGTLEQARTEIGEAIDLHRSSRNRSSLIDDLTFLHYLHFYQLGNFEKAREILFEELPEPIRGDGDTAYLVAFYRGQWAVHGAQPRTALRELERAAHHAGRLGRPRARMLAEQLLAFQLRRLGRRQEGTARFDQLLESIESLPRDCDKAKLLNNASWDRLLDLEARFPGRSPAAGLERALPLVDDCPELDVDERVNQRLSLALAYLHDGDLQAAREQLEHARTAARPGRLWAWRNDLEGRIALAMGRTQTALDHFRALARLASAADRPDVAWRAAVGRAQVLEASGKTDGALSALALAEDFLDAESLRAPVDAGRETSVAEREWATRRYLDLLIRRGRVSEALAAARRARSRFFRGLAHDARLRDLGAEERKLWSATVLRYNELRSAFESAVARDWAVPLGARDLRAAERVDQSKELARRLDDAIAILDAGRSRDLGPPPPVPPGDLLLAYHPAPNGWFAFAASAGTVAVLRLAPLDVSGSSPAELAGDLIEPFADKIHKARRVRILPYGTLRAVDFHALPFAGDVLVATKPVVYGLDLPPVPEGSERRALLVRDPTGTLRTAPREVALVGRSVARWGGWRIHELGQDADLRALLPRVDLLHFAGHADFAGRGLESALRLDRDGAARLTAGDVLALGAAPARVVLSACESARSDAGDAPVSLGLAHAFLLAGSRVVVGAQRPVDDQVSAALIRLFYGSWDGLPDNAATALARAQRVLRRRDPQTDWHGFRVLER